MKDYITRLSKGEFEYDFPKIESMSPIREEVVENSVFTGKFELKATGHIYGTSYATIPEVTVESTFKDNRVEVTYTVNAVKRKPDDVIKGEIEVVTSGGQVTVPFEFMVAGKRIEGKGYCIEDLESFLLLAKKDPISAVQVFERPEFSAVVIRDNVMLKGLFNELVNSADMRIAVKEFIKVADINNITETVQDDELSEDSNNDNKGTRSKDNSFGRSGFSEFLNEWNKIKIAMTRGYLDFRMKKITLKDWTGEFLSRLSDTEFLSLYNFSQIEKYAYLELAVAKALLLSLEGNNKDANLILNNYSEAIEEDRRNNGILYYASLYAKTRLATSVSEIEQIKKLFFNVIDNANTPWQVLIFQYHLDKNSDDNASIWLTRFKDAYNNGCCSPIVYLEAIRIFNKHPILLRVLNSFETQVIRFGYRYSLVEPNTTTRFIELIAKENDFNSIHLRSLKYLYDEYNSDDILATLCHKMIQGQLVGPEYVNVYEKAIKRRLKITGLYEYYLTSLYKSSSVDKQIPEPVLRYFVYESNIDNNVKAFLYANVINMRDREKEIFLLYREMIVSFTRDRMSGGFIDDNLVILYRWLFSMPNTLDASLASQVFRLQYTYRIFVEDENLVNVIIRHPEFKTSKKIPIKDLKVYAFIMSGIEDINNKCVICFEDMDGNILSDKSCMYSMERVIDTDNFIVINDDNCDGAHKCISDPYFNLHMYRSIAKTERIPLHPSSSAVVFAKNLLSYPQITHEFEKELNMALYGNVDGVAPVNGDESGPDHITVKSDKARIAEYESQLAQMLFTKCDYKVMSPVFKELCKLGGEGLVADAYIADQAFTYFVQKQEADEEIFPILYERLRNGKKQLPVELAALIFHSGRSWNLSEEEKELFSIVVGAFVKKGFIFDFFKDLNEDIEIPYYIGDKTIIEYFGKPKQKVLISFESGRLKDHKVKALETFCGIYTYPMVLFENESADYFITIDEKTDEPIHGIVKNNGNNRDNDGRFELLSKMLVRSKEISYDNIKDDLEEYEIRDVLNRKLFEVI